MKFPSTSYRYSIPRIRSYSFGFNGQLKDNEVYGEGNGYDFGARICDPRIGRFMSIDPRTSEYPFMSPYSFAANSPLRFNDVNGEWPGEVLDARYTGNGNVIIYIADKDQVSQAGVAAMRKASGNWDFVIATDIQAAADYLNNTYKKDNNTYSTALIRTHSGTDQYTGKTGIVDNVAIPTSQIGTKEDNNPLQFYQYVISAQDITNYSPLNDTKENTGAGALISILQGVSEGGSVVYSACSMAGRPELADASAKAQGGSITIYLNSAHTTVGDVGKPLTKNENYADGWKQFNYEGGKRTSQYNTKSDLQLNPNGGVSRSSPNAKVTAQNQQTKQQTSGD